MALEFLYRMELGGLPYGWGWQSSQRTCPEIVIKWQMHSSYMDFFFKYIFNWRIIALQCCVGFCHTSMWIRYIYIYIYIYIYMYVCIYVSMNLPATPSHPSRLSQSPHLSSLEPYSKVPLAVLFTYGGVCFHATLSIHPLHSSHLLLPWTPTPPHPQICSLCLHLHCCPANRFISTIFLGSLYMCL